MESRFRIEDAPKDPVALRAYTSRLLGAEPSLVLHGGGNTSVKVNERGFLGDMQDVLYVKGSGWDLASIEPAGFSPVRLDVLLRLAEFPTLSDSDMVREQRAALLNPDAPNPSVEAILHALIPARYVDHTHADAVVTLSNCPQGAERIAQVYGARLLVVPYVMPGFVLARAIYEQTRDVDWNAIEGMILMNHGVFTFADDAKESYERMIRVVDQAERELAREKASACVSVAEMPSTIPPDALTRLRAAVSQVRGGPVVVRADTGVMAAGFASRPDAQEMGTRGPVTPDHVIRTKRIPLVIGDEDDLDATVATYASAYQAYFESHASEGLQCLDPAPRWGIWKGRGILSFGPTPKLAAQISDIVRHSVRCFQWAEALGGWSPLGEKDIFDMEYWELEQRKLRSKGKPSVFAGKVAMVTGGATGIGRATAEALRSHGAAVVVLDIVDEVAAQYRGNDALGIRCDMTEPAAVTQAVMQAVRHFGGLDILVANAGNFPPSQSLSAIEDTLWQQTMRLNLDGHMHVLRAASPFLQVGVDPAVVIMASRNVLAPGPGAAAYSCAKAALTQLGRIAALELGPKGVRVNTLHPDKIFDTELWTDEKIALRAAHYGLSVEAYKRSNMLGVEVVSSDVANAVCALVGSTFRCTTGAQIAIDGGNARVI